jgi:hypothetical protein
LNFTVVDIGNFLNNIMNPVVIPEEDTISYREFSDGKPVQVRISVPDLQAKGFGKGKPVNVIHEGKELKGRIVSDPLEIDTDNDKHLTTLALVIEKTDAF